MSNSRKPRKLWKILLKFEFIVKRLQVGFGTFFFWPLAEIPLTHLERLSAIRYLLPDCCFETICTLLLTGNHSDLHSTALGNGKRRRAGWCRWKASLFGESLSPVKCRENEPGGLVGCRAERWADVFTGAWPLGKQTSQNVDVCENWCATWSKHAYITHTSQGDQIPRQRL